VANVQSAQQTGTGTVFLDAYGRMLLIRLFETAMHRLFLEGEVHGTTHLYAGQEAVAVGTCLALTPEDYATGTYRGHGHALAKGTDPGALIAEMLGRASGVCGGRAGSMNVIDLEHGLVGCYGIVGGSIAAGLGAGLSAKCLNMAKVAMLPVVFVCENNFYAEFTPLAEATAGANIAGRARAYDVPSAVVDGNDLWAVYAAADEAVKRARDGGGPTLLECQTYRHYGHSKGDPAPYRPKGEVEQWLERDPLKLARSRLLDEGMAQERIVAVEEATAALMDEAVHAARDASYPDPETDAATEFHA
jgi:TPP-dependent pyruvate/acetoin dehydrogenase alpha subunit